eukprot:4444671-Prymnesium_polylepis.1
MALPSFIHAVIIRSRKVTQLRAAEFRGAHVGAGRWGHAHRAGKWAKAQSDARTIDATAWCT